MTWIILVVALWLKGGIPEAHAVVLNPGIGCTEQVAKAVAAHFQSVSDHKDDLTTNFSWSCENADLPEGVSAPTAPPSKPAAPKKHVPSKDET